ncbi:MAG: aminotransferase class V-fold PLP-dependent enzyme [Firmicutes bacterium]|nr:aminotransferase class V-fold PLP-dependent enzyme [Bacillota bacterium]
MKKSVTQFLLDHAAEKPVSFHMPGHKGSDIYRRYGYDEFLNNFIDCDITEIPGADNLFQTEGVIRETAEKYRRLYDVKKSYLLINGTSGGLIAAILASVPQGKKLVMARNCHKSVFNALTLGGIEPVYAYPSMVEEYGISGAVEAEEIARCLDENPEAEAVILPSPNYYGICSDIKAIADVVHARGKVLIVDQAHGAHLKFMAGEPKAAEECGADIVVNSTHKTLCSFTQSAVLNYNSDRVEQYILEDKLQAIQSTSPSYLLMASLDINADILEKHGERLFSAWQSNIEDFYAKAAAVEGLKLMEVPGAMDKTKINIDMSRYGIDGNQLEELLMEKGFYSELVTGNILMCMTGIGNTGADFERLLVVLKSIAEERAFDKDGSDHSGAAGTEGCDKADNSGAALWMKRRALHEIPKKKQQVHIDESEGLICAASIIPYPPGIPFVCPGEEIGREEIEYIKLLRNRGEKVIGVDENMCVVVGKE